LVYENLDPTIDVGDIEKVTLSHIAQGGDPAGDANGLFLFEIFTKFTRGVGSFVSLAEWINSLLAKFFEFLSTHFQELSKIFILRGLVLL